MDAIAVGNQSPVVMSPDQKKLSVTINRRVSHIGREETLLSFMSNPPALSRKLIPAWPSLRWGQIHVERQALRTHDEMIQPVEVKQCHGKSD